MGMTIDEKHELILSFNSSEELWQFLKEHEDKVVGMIDYKINKWEQEDGNNIDLRILEQKKKKNVSTKDALEDIIPYLMAESEVEDGQNTIKD